NAIQLQREASCGILSVRYGRRSTQACERGGKRRLEELLDHASADSRIPGVQRSRPFAWLLRHFRRRNREFVREVQRDHPDGWSEDASDRSDQDPRQTLRNVGAEAGLSLLSRWR